MALRVLVRRVSCRDLRGWDFIFGVNLSASKERSHNVLYQVFYLPFSLSSERPYAH